MLFGEVYLLLSFPCVHTAMHDHTLPISAFILTTSDSTDHSAKTPVLCSWWQCHLITVLSLDQCSDDSFIRSFSVKSSHRSILQPRSQSYPSSLQLISWRPCIYLCVGLLLLDLKKSLTGCFHPETPQNTSVGNQVFISLLNLFLTHLYQSQETVLSSTQLVLYAL